MRQYPVPVLFDERPREIGGLITFRQAGYLGAGLMLVLYALVEFPVWLAVPAVATGVFGSCLLAFARVRFMAADRLLWLLALYLMRPRAVFWQRGGDRVC